MSAPDYAAPYASDRALDADIRHYENRRPEPEPHPLDQLDRGNASAARNQKVRLLLGDLLSELPPAQLDEIADCIHHAHQVGGPVDYKSIGKAVADYVTHRLVS